MMADEVDMVEADAVMDGDFFDHEPTKAARIEVRVFDNERNKRKDEGTIDWGSLSASLVQIHERFP